MFTSIPRVVSVFLGGGFSTGLTSIFLSLFAAISHLPASMSVPPFTMALVFACPVSLPPSGQSASLCLPCPLLPLSPLPGMSAGGLSPVCVPLLLLASNPCWAVNSLLVLSVRVTRVPCPFSSCCPAHCLGGCAPCVPTCLPLIDLHCSLNDLSA